MAAAAATAFPDATDAAIAMLRAGGNAVDAAVAAAWALAVCEPAASGIGGQTVLLVRLPGAAPIVIDGHSHAPAAASLASIGPREQRRGHRACVVPSTVATLDYAQRRFGRLTAEAVLAPAIAIAENGYRITELQAKQTGRVAVALRSAGGAASVFLSPDGRAPQPGAILRQPALAATLTRLVRAGAEDFYRGAIAREISTDMERRGGLLDYSDLARVALPVERAPIATAYRGRAVLSAPPPGGGPQIASALDALAASASRLPAAGTPAWYSALARAVEAAFRAREGLAPDSPPVARDRQEVGDTTHLTVVDHEGGVVALTQSIQSIFGAKVAHPTLGFVYNNYLCTCPRSPQHPYALRGGGQPRSNAAPTIVFDGPSTNGRPLLALGAAGSRRIISSIVAVVAAVVDGGLDLRAAVSLPRVHALLDGRVWLERAAATDAVIDRLRVHFRQVSIRPTHDPAMGCVQAVHCLDDGRVDAAADPRRDGTAIVDEAVATARG
jgi:gamma-glutamyltranspeptidase / glutathione hydrolase